MKDKARLLWLSAGLLIGLAGSAFFVASPRPAFAFNDRHEDYILATGTMTLAPNFNADCVWLLDYRAGKLLGTTVDRTFGKINPFAEVDLVKQFNIPPKQNVHFMMTTGSVIAGQTAMYLVEINTGRFGVYTMAPKFGGGIEIRMHDATLFRQPAANPAP